MTTREWKGESQVERGDGVWSVHAIPVYENSTLNPINMQNYYTFIKTLLKKKIEKERKNGQDKWKTSGIDWRDFWHAHSNFQNRAEQAKRH